MTETAHKKYVDDLVKDPARLKVFLRQIMGRPHKTLEGKEKERIVLLLTMIDPFKVTNNQHSYTEYYMIGEKEYHITTFPGDDVIVDEMLNEDET